MAVATAAFVASGDNDSYYYHLGHYASVALPLSSQVFLRPVAAGHDVKTKTNFTVYSAALQRVANGRVLILGCPEDSEHLLH